MALACSLGYQAGGNDRAPEALPVAERAEAPVSAPSAERCQRLSEQIASCSGAVTRAWQPQVSPLYTGTLRKLVEIKKRDALSEDAARICRGGPDDPAAPGSLEDCLDRPTCSDFARCVAESAEE
jgi:hypothetical protein